MSDATTDWHEVHDSTVGAIARVLSVSDDHHQIHIQYPGGAVGRFNTSDPVDLLEGDVVVVNDERIEKGPRALWKVPESIAVVREIIGEDVLVEVDGRLRVLRKPDNLSIQPDTTVMFTETDGITRQLAPRVIRPKLIDRDEDVDLAPFRMPALENATFDSFGGYKEIVLRARTLIETQLNKSDHLEAIGAKPIKGVLFAGPSGTGKTMLARTIAEASGAAFFLIGGPSIVTKWLGDSEQLLRRIFEAAAAASSAIIFFDEIDSIAAQRSEDSHESSNRLVAQLLSLMDGATDSGGNIVVIAATNRPEDIDNALRRPGRFDWTIYFEYPSKEDRLDILRITANSLAINGELPFADLAVGTEGWSAAELASLWSEAAIAAASDDRNALDEEDVILAFERIESRRRGSQGGLSVSVA